MMVHFCTSREYPNKYRGMKYHATLDHFSSCSRNEINHLFLVCKSPVKCGCSNSGHSWCCHLSGFRKRCV